MMRQIIVPLDGSARAESALPIAAHIARAHEGTLFLIRIVGTSADYAWYAGEMAMMLPEVMEVERKEAADYLTQIAASPALRHLDAFGSRAAGRGGWPMPVHRRRLCPLQRHRTATGLLGRRR